MRHLEDREYTYGLYLGAHSSIQDFDTVTANVSDMRRPRGGRKRDYHLIDESRETAGELGL